MIKTGPYKGYTGTAIPEEDGPEWYGRVDNIRDVITFVAEPDKLEEEFHISVDDYLELCVQRGEQPNIPLTNPHDNPSSS